MSTRQDILTHAEGMARSRGYDGFSFADLAAGAKIRKASVHYHFPTKAALSVELVDVYAARVMTALDAVADQPAANRLETILGLYRDALEDGRSQCLCVAFSAMTERLPEETRARIATFQTDVLSWLVETFGLARSDTSIAGVSDPTRDAAATFAQLEGAQLMARASGDPSQFDLATATLQARIQKGP